MIACDFDLVLRDPHGRPPDGECLQHEANLEQVAEVVDVEGQHAGALVGDVLGEAERLELAHRLANGGNAHAERARQLVEPQRRPRLQLAQDDRLAQLLERELGHRPVPDSPRLGCTCTWHPAQDRPMRLIRCQTLCEDHPVAFSSLDPCTLIPQCPTTPSPLRGGRQ